MIDGHGVAWALWISVGRGNLLTLLVRCDGETKKDEKEGMRRARISMLL